MHIEDQRKKDYLDEHLPYMLKMLRYTYKQMLEQQHYLSWNAHFESFAVHARNLVAFLTNNDTGNFKAKEFVAQDYKAVKGDLQGPMKKLDEQVFHLAKTRPTDVVGKFDTKHAEIVSRWIEKNFADFLNQLGELRPHFNDKKAERRHLLRKLARRREDQRPGQLGRGVGRRAGVLARRHDDAETRTGLDVDVRIDAALADEFELGQPFEQRRSNGRALADEHQAFGVLEPRRERVGILHVVVPDRNLVSLELLEAGKRAQRVEIIVQNRNLHALRSANRRRRSRQIRRET
jgi:hypothetical protein